MIVVVSVETVVLVLLVALVAGLLRSHAEILRRLGPDDAPAPARPGIAPLPPRRTDRPGRVPPALAGVTPAGDTVRLELAVGERLTLLAFLSSGCSTCASFWSGLSEPRLPGGVDVIAVTRGVERERLAAVRRLAPSGLAVVMSSQAWADYEVPGAPYFVLVGREILGEGAASSWSALSSLVSDAVQDERQGLRPEADGPASGARDHAASIDETLLAAGIGPDHPSLFPSRGARQ